MATATQLRGGTVRVSQLQAQARKSAQRAYEQVKQTQKKPTAQDTQKAKDLYTAAKMVLSGKGESNVSAQTKKYEQAIRYPWSPAYESLSPEEKKVVSQLNLQYKAGITEAQQAKKAIESLNKITTTPQISPTQDLLSKSGTYDISTKTYTSPMGEKYSMAQAPKGAVIQSDLSRIIQKKGEDYNKIIKLETQRYQDIGYTTGQSKMLAEESVKEGGKSFTPNEAERIIKQKGYLRQIKEEGILPPTVRKVSNVVENILTGVGKVTNLPTTTEATPLGILLGTTETGRKIKKIAPKTIGENVLFVKEGLGYIGDISSSGVNLFFEKIGIETEKVIKETYVPQYQRATITGMGTNILETPTTVFIPENKQETVAGLFVKGVKLAPEVLAWTLAPEVMAGVEVISSAEKLKKLDKEADKILNKQYQEYSKQEPEEGYRLLTKEEFFKQYKTETMNQLRQEVIVGGGLSLAFLGLSAGARVYKAVTKPVIKYRSFDIKTGKYIEGKIPQEVQWFREISGTTPKGKISTYKIFQYKSPVEMEVTTKIREVLGLKPKIEWTPITKPQIYITRPAFGSWIIGDKSYIAETGRLSKVPYGLKTEEDILKFYQTAKYTPKKSFFKITGGGEVINPEEIFKLPRPEQYTWFGGGEKIVVQREGEQFIQSALESKRYYGKIGDVTQIYTPDKYLKQLGKTSETYYTASKIKPIIEIPEKEITIYETITKFKPTTKPFYRASGKISELKGTIIESPFKDVSGFGDFDSLSFFGGRTNKKSTNILKDILTKPVEKIVPPTPKVNIRKVNIPESTIFIGGKTVPLVESLYPTYVGGTQVPDTKVDVFTYPIYTGEEQQFTFKNLGMIEPKKTIIKNYEPLINMDLGLKTESQIKEIIKTQPKIINKEILRIQPKVQIKEILKVQPKVMLKEILKIQQKQIQKSILKQVQKQRVKTKPKIKPKTIKPIIPFTPIIIGEKISAKEKLLGLFEIFKKSKGKFVSVGFGKTEEEAGKKLGKELFSGLEASGFVVEKRTGRKISFEKLGLGDAFRKSKQKGKEFLAVQKRSKRLLSGVERRKIQKERKKYPIKKKKKGIRWF